MKLGVNLSFAVKRFIDPPRVAALVRDQLRIRHVQYTWDLSDPWWPAERRDRVAREWARAFRDAGLIIESTFGGLASYTYNNLLAPTEDLREAGYEHLARAVDMTAAMEVPAAGMPLGGFSHEVARQPSARERVYAAALDLLARLARHARSRGLSMLLVEPTPLVTEFPSTPAEAVRLMNDLEGKTEVPIRLLVDWGHALYEPLYGADASVERWIETCRRWVAAFHVQQTDGQLDRHWNFTHAGLLTPERLRQAWDRWGLRDETFFMEIVYPFEADDAHVLDEMTRAAALLNAVA